MNITRFVCVDRIKSESYYTEVSKWNDDIMKQRINYIHM